MSPSRLDVDAGIVVFGGVILAFCVIAPILVPILVSLFFAGLISMLALFRIFKRHSIKCSYRWAAIAVLGIGGWISPL
jgi:hypothetical protein